MIGHEVGHAIAKHGQERASQQMLTSLGSQVLGTVTANSSSTIQQAVATAYGLGTQYGALLPFSRKHELEADYIGIVLATVAGYDADAAVTLWQKMEAVSTTSVPQFASTHPSSSKRISELQKNIPTVKATYGQAAQAAASSTSTTTSSTSSKSKTQSSKKSGTGYKIGN